MKPKSNTLAGKLFGKNTGLSKHTKVKKNEVISTLSIPICITKKIKNK